jgi:hypothetical protein
MKLKILINLIDFKSKKKKKKLKDSNTCNLIMRVRIEANIAILMMKFKEKLPNN